MLLLVVTSLLVAFLGWLIYHFLFSLPRLDLSTDRAFVDGKVVWITGASSGIGQSLAEYLRGLTNVRVVLSARSVGSLEKVKKDLISSGVKEVMVLPIDLIQLADDITVAQSKVDQVLKQFGRIDILIHNGGMSMRGDVASTKLEVDHQVMKCNYFGAIALTKAVLPSMLDEFTRDGRISHIVVMSSVQGKLPIAFRSAYAASKHAMHGFFHSLRYEVAELGCKVTIICPGYVKTNISLNALTADGGRYGIMDTTQASGYEPEYVAGLTYAATRLGLDEIIVADRLARAAIMLYAIAPQLLTQQMLKRTKKERTKLKEKKEQ